MADIFNIAGQIHSTSEEQTAVVASEVKDERMDKKQSVINQEVDGQLNNPTSGLEDRVTALEQGATGSGDTPIETNPSGVVAGSGKVTTANAVRGAIDMATGYFECATAASTVAKVITGSSVAGFVLPTIGGSFKVKFAHRNSAANPTLNINGTGAKAIYYNGQAAGSGNTWDDNETVEIFYDGTNYQANNVAGNSGDGVFDISVYNAVDGVAATYADLAAALGTNGANVPVAKRNGGMSVKFIQSSDNKYVQYRYTGIATTGNPNPFLDTIYWQEEGDTLEKAVLTKKDVVEYGFLQSDGTLYPNNSWGTTGFLYVELLDEILICLKQASSQVYVCFYDSSKTFLSSTNAYNSLVSTLLPVPSNAVYMKASFNMNEANAQYVRGSESSFRFQIIHDNDVLSKFIRGQKIFVSELWYDGLIQGFIQDSEGTIYPNINYRVSEYIPISSEAIYIYQDSYHNQVYMAFYDSSKNLLSAITYPSLVETRIEPPEGAAYMRLSMNSSHINDAYFYKEIESRIIKGTVSTSILNQSITNVQNIWFQITPWIKHVDAIRFLAKTGTIYFYKVNTNTTPATITSLKAVEVAAADNDRVKGFKVNVDLSDGEYIGVNGTFAYSATGNEGYFGGNCKADGTSVRKNSSGFACGFEVICNLMSIIESLVSDAEQIVTLDATGNGDYTTIYDALKYTVGIDTAQHPLTILVKPGIYITPTLPPSDFFADYVKNRHLAIIGTDKVNCILRNDKGYYNASASQEGNLGDNSVIKVDGNVYIANLTLISTDNENESEVSELYHRSYCVHADSQSPSGSIFEIHNCHIINDHAPCIGFGIYPNTTLKITDCELEADFFAPESTHGGAIIYGHDQEGSTSVVEEHLIVKNCTLISSNGHAVKFINNMDSLADCIFVNNACALPQGKGVVLGNTTTVIPPSFGNSIEDMNA